MTGKKKTCGMTAGREEDVFWTNSMLLTLFLQKEKRWRRRGRSRKKK
jgi:hypothetical protein